MFQIVLAAAGRVVPGKRITPQGLRKTFIELALAEGEPLEAIINATLRGWGAGYKRASIK